MRNDFESNYLMHWGLKKGAQKDKHKYFARVELGEKNGRMQYRYFYSLAEYAAYMKGEAKNKLKELNKNKEKILSDKINIGVKKLEEEYNKLDKNNKYMTDDYNYDKKIAQVKQTKEWKDIVRRKDPEYVYKDKNGKTVYDVDAYLAKKKHPVLDAMDDIVMGRKVTLNKVEKESAVAGVADYAKTYVTMAAIGTKFLLEKFKFSQGSYKEEKQAAIDYAVQNKDKVIQTASMVNSASSDPRVIQAISDGEKYINQYASQVQNVDVDSLSKSSGLSKEDYEQIKKDYNTVKNDIQKASSAVSSAANTVESTAKTSQNGGTTAKKAATPKASTPAAKTPEKKTSNQEDHKYVERVKEGDSYRYFYTQEEYDAYLKDEEKKKAVSNMTKNARYT